MSGAETFAFDPETEAEAKAIVQRYPAGRQASAVLPVLWLAQHQCGGWLPRAALDYVADFLEMAPIRVYEVASFYDMFNTRPVGRHQIRVCTTTPCWLCGSDDVVRACKDALGVDIGGSTADGRFFLREFECLGACANAPMMWIDDDYYEDLTYDSARAIIETLKRGETPTPGSQTGRKASMAAGGKTTLFEDPHRMAVDSEEGAGDRDQEPVEKGRPEAEVKAQAEATERDGRPAEAAGEGDEADQAESKPRRGRSRGKGSGDKGSGKKSGRPEGGADAE